MRLPGCNHFRTGRDRNQSGKHSVDAGYIDRGDFEAVFARSYTVLRHEAFGHAELRVVRIAPIIDRIDPAGSASLRTVARHLNAEGVPTPGGNGVWTAAAVARVRKRLDAAQA